MMKMIKEGTEWLSKQISSNINNFIANQKTVSYLPKKQEVLLLHRVNGTNPQVQVLVFVCQRYSSVSLKQNKKF